MYILSKSSFLRGSQCQKSLFLDKFHKELKDKITLSQESIFEQGTNVGYIARSLFPGGIEVSTKNSFDYSSAVSITKDLVQKKTPVLYEATFLFNECLVAVDILIKQDDKGHSCFEIKSSTELKEQFLLDAAFQYYVLINSGIRVTDFSIVFIDNQYIRQDRLEIDRLFKVKSVLNEIIVLQDYIKKQVEYLKLIITEKETPAVDIGIHCNDPYKCDYLGYCWKNIPRPSVFDIANLKASKKFELYHKGIIKLENIPKEFNLTPNQRLQIESEVNNIVHIEKDKINEFVCSLNYPLGFLDFETFQTAIPLFKNSKPYQQIVFQYSLHKQYSRRGSLEHAEFIAEADGNDPRISFIERLVNDCNDLRDILVYNISFEKTRLLELSVDFPDYSEGILGIIVRLKDLMVPFKEKWYYVPKMNGSYSIKAVLPALIPELNYENLEIKDGETASNIFSAMMQNNYKGNMDSAKKSLLMYCNLDTLAMVKILEKLNPVI